MRSCLAAFGSLEETEATLASLGSFLVCISILVWIDGRPLRSLAPAEDDGAPYQAGRIGASVSTQPTPAGLWPKLGLAMSWTT